MSVELLELFPHDVTEPVAGRVRRTDPATSHAAANDATCAVLHGSQRFKLLRAYADLGSLTDEQAGIREGIRRVADTRRCSELRRAGLIQPDGTSGETSTGASAMRCVITHAGRKALEAARKKAS